MEYIASCKNFDGGFGCTPGEDHGQDRNHRPPFLLFGGLVTPFPRFLSLFLFLVFHHLIVITIVIVVVVCVYVCVCVILDM